MKTEERIESACELPVVAAEPAVQISKEHEIQGRSQPLQSTYNSTFIILVLSIAVIVAIILLVWPSHGF